jgi:endonuclease YncB( thermonuclease family)
MIRPTFSHGWGRRFNPCTAHQETTSEIKPERGEFWRWPGANHVGYVTGTSREDAGGRVTELARRSRTVLATFFAGSTVGHRMRRPSPILGLIAGGALAAAAALWQPGIRVVDGDTVDHGFWRWRLEGFDAPETGSRARCHEERVLGQSAKLRLAEAVGDGKAVLVPVGPVWRVDRYGRRLGRLAIDGRDAGDILTAEGLARPYDRGQRPAWCAG